MRKKTAEPAQNENEVAVIPPLRPDLELYPAPCETDGSPTWTLRDPVTSSFLKFDWEKKEILDRLKQPIKLTDLWKRITSETTISMTFLELSGFCQDLITQNLTCSGLHKSVDVLNAKACAQKMPSWKWLMHHYLYFRIPLFHPNKFLGKTIGAVSMLASNAALCLYAFLSLVGCYFLLSRFDSYIHTFPRFYNLHGLLVYYFGIAGVKVLHEFSHAYVAKYYKNRVPTIGLAFMIMMPLLYSDVSDTWRMRSRRKRFLVHSAGAITELIIAGLSLFAWGITGGVWQSLFFLLSSVTLAGTLLVNLNPGMRFDGYYLLSDLLGIDNLRERADNIARWLYQKYLFGIEAPCPEAKFSRTRLILLGLYSIYAWAYRSTLYISIALLVYYKFNFKLLAMTMFSIEAIFFLLRPLHREILSLYGKRKSLTVNPKITTSLLLCLLFLLWFILPMSHTIKLPAIVVPNRSQTIYAPYPGKVTDIKHKRGDRVLQNDVIASLASDELDMQIGVLKSQLQSLEAEIETLSASQEDKALLPQKKEAFRKQKALLAEYLSKIKQMELRTNASGTIYDIDETLCVGVYVPQLQEIARVGDLEHVSLVAFIPENELNYINENSGCKFIADNQAATVKARITHIQNVNMVYLEYPGLSSLHGGDLATVPEKSQKLKMIDSFYKVSAEVMAASETQHPFRFDQTGTLYVVSKPYSLFKYYFNMAVNLLNRELSL